MADHSIPKNVDTDSDDNKKKVKSLWEIVCYAIDYDSGLTKDEKKKIKAFLVYFAGHESECLKKRVQISGKKGHTYDGPARGLFQMQRPAAIDALEYIKKNCETTTKDLMFILKVTKEKLCDYIDDLKKHKGTHPKTKKKNSDYFPKDDPIEKALKESDIFAAFLAWYYIKKYKKDDPFPGSEDFDGAADFWQKYWHKGTKNVDEDKEKFKKKAKELQPLLPS